MQVLHIIKATGIAGAERHLLLLLPALRARGVDARLLVLESTKPQDVLAKHLQTLGVPVDRRVMDRHLDLMLLPWLIGYLRAQQPALIQAHLSHAQLYAILAANLVGIPVITGHHNDDPFLRRWPFRPLFRQLWRRTAGGVAISSAVAAFCREIEGGSADRLRVIRYGVPTPDVTVPYLQEGRAALRAQLGLSINTVVVGCVGRLIEQKGVTYGISAFAQVQRQHADTVLVIVGDGPLRETLAAQAVSLAPAETIRFLGWQDDASRWMQAFDIFLFPSLWEGFGLVLLEAMGAGLPVIASRVSAIPEIVVDGETGILVSPRDTAGLAEGLTKLIMDESMRRRMGRSGLARLVSHFSADRMVDETISLYNDIVNSGSA